MELRTLGRTGVRVSAHCLGTMMLGRWGNPDHREGVRIINAALDAGVNFVDTADVYSEGESEEIVGEALRTRRDDVVLATKFHGTMGKGPNRRGNSRLWIMRAVEDSLRRLETDRIDLYQVHRPDPSTDLEETLGALTDLVRQGKVLYAGCSTFPAWQVVESHWISERRGLERFVCEQPPYSIFVRHCERDLFPVAQRYGMGIIVWSPLNGGWLAGRYRRGQGVPADSRAERYKDRGRLHDRFDLLRDPPQRKLDLVEDLAAVADKAGLPLIHLALAFSLTHPAVTSSIIGPRTSEQLQDLLAAADIRLDMDTLDAIDEIVPAAETIDHADRGWAEPWMRPEARRR